VLLGLQVDRVGAGLGGEAVVAEAESSSSAAEEKENSLDDPFVRRMRARQGRSFPLVTLPGLRTAVPVARMSPQAGTWIGTDAGVLNAPPTSTPILPS
jgi:hypothetical protein